MQKKKFNVHRLNKNYLVRIKWIFFSLFQFNLIKINEVEIVNLIAVSSIYLK